MYTYTHTHTQSSLPKAATSLKVLAELPIIVVLMYQVTYTIIIIVMHTPYVRTVHMCISIEQCAHVLFFYPCGNRQSMSDDVVPPPPSPQLYKATVHSTVSEFIPLTMKTIVLQPSAKARSAPSFNKETYVDFVAIQIKFLSFLAYIIRIYQDQVRTFT